MIHGDVVLTRTVYLALVLSTKREPVVTTLTTFDTSFKPTIVKASFTTLTMMEYPHDLPNIPTACVPRCCTPRGTWVQSASFGHQSSSTRTFFRSTPTCNGTKFHIVVVFPFEFTTSVMNRNRAKPKRILKIAIRSVLSQGTQTVRGPIQKLLDLPMWSLANNARRQTTQREGGKRTSSAKMKRSSTLEGNASQLGNQKLVVSDASLLRTTRLKKLAIRRIRVSKQRLGSTATPPLSSQIREVHADMTFQCTQPLDNRFATQKESTIQLILQFDGRQPKVNLKIRTDNGEQIKLFPRRVHLIQTT